MDFLKIDKAGFYSLNKWVLHPLDLSVPEGQNLAIIGETGSGKSTLLKLMAGLAQPSSGAVYFQGKKVDGPLEKLIPGHPRIGYLSQHFELHNNYQVFDLLEYANKLTDQEAALIYETCDITHLLQRKTHQLSGGEKQRIALARILTMRPSLLLLDEPYSNLDWNHRAVMKRVISDLESKMGLTCFMVSHDAPDILSWAHKMLVLKEGELIQAGSPEEVYHHPVNEYVAGLLGKYNMQLPSTFKKNDLTANKFAITRPEDLTILSSGSGGATAIIQRKLFHGAYYEYEVEINDQQSLLVYVSSGNWQIGETVEVALRAAVGL